jgi:hypothetical protein
MGYVPAVQGRRRVRENFSRTRCTISLSLACEYKCTCTSQGQDEQEQGGVWREAATRVLRGRAGGRGKCARVPTSAVQPLASLCCWCARRRPLCALCGACGQAKVESSLWRARTTPNLCCFVCSLSFVYARQCPFTLCILFVGI